MLTICIETAAIHRFVALGQDGVLLESHRVGKRDDIATTLGSAIGWLLEAHGFSRADIHAVAVDVGPGGLTATRCGVTFANALSYGLGVPKIAMRQFEMLGKQAWSVCQKPTVCILKSAGGNGFVAWYDKDGLTSQAHGPLLDSVRKLICGKEGFAVTGFFPEEIATILPSNATVLDSLSSPTAETLVSMAYDSASRSEFAYQPVEALNDRSADFA